MEKKNDEIAVYVPKETILKEMATIKLRQHFFFYIVWELSDTPHIRENIKISAKKSRLL
jgi:hypothetical protein